jgi:hypothetical protein
LVVTEEEEDEEEEETRRNKTSRRHQNLKASSSRGGPQFVEGNKSSATKYLHTCAARDSSRHGNSGQDEEEEEECPENETTPEEKKGRGRGPRRVRDPHKSSPSFRTRKQLEHERKNREGEAMQAGRPTTCNTLCGTATDWWYRTVPKWTHAKWTYSTSALALCSFL